MEIVYEATARKMPKDEKVLKAAKKLLTLKNVTGYGIGYKVIGGQRTPIPCLTVLVTKKEPLDVLSKRNIIPSQIKGKKTDVIESGVIEALGRKSIDRTKRQRPAPCGVSCGHYKITAGTQGMVVKRGISTFILSNNHVLADSNEAKIGDPIYQPGPYDGGKDSDTYAHLSEFIEIKFLEDTNCPVTKAVLWFLNGLSRLLSRGTRFKATGTQLTNRIDGALAIVREENVDPIQLELGSTQGINYELCVGDKVKKSGRTSGITEGEVLLTNGVARVSYGGGRTALFTSQIITSGMLEGGDSGSALLADDNKVVGLCFAGSSQVGIANRIESVMDELGIEEVL